MILLNYTCAQRLPFLQCPLEGGSKSESIFLDFHVKMTNVTQKLFRLYRFMSLYTTCLNCIKNSSYTRRSSELGLQNFASKGFVSLFSGGNSSPADSSRAGEIKKAQGCRSGCCPTFTRSISSLSPNVAVLLSNSYRIHIITEVPSYFIF